MSLTLKIILRHFSYCPNIFFYCCCFTSLFYILRFLTSGKKYIGTIKRIDTEKIQFIWEGSGISGEENTVFKLLNVAISFLRTASEGGEEQDR